MPSGRTIGQDLLNVPMGDMIRQMALSIAEAQLALDESGVRQAELMSGRVVLRDAQGRLVDETGVVVQTPKFIDSMVYFGYRRAEGDVTTPERVSMMELGFTPTFYQFIDTVIEVKIAIKITEEDASTRVEKGYRTSYTFGSGRNGFFYNSTCTPVDATYSSKYNYSAEGASLLRTKLAPVPPPAILEERARILMQQNEADRAASRKGAGKTVSSTNG